MGSGYSHACKMLQIILFICGVVLVVKNPLANADLRDRDLNPGSRRSPGGGHGNPLQYSRLNPMEGGAWRATVHRVTKLDLTEVT